MAATVHTQNKSVVYKAKQAVLVVRIQWVIFLGMIFASIVPIIALYMLTERNLLQQEIASVDENHLIIARNLEAAIDRYTNDVASVLVLVSSDLNGFKDQETKDILDDFDIQTVALFNSEGSLENEVSGSGNISAKKISSQLLYDLREISEKSPNEVVFSGVRQFNGTPHLFAVLPLDNDTTIIAILAPTYLIKMQRSIKFGKLGHSMMVDQFGKIIAHPNVSWQETSKDVSKLSVVQKMISGETGVATFYSPAMNADMISGFTFVARTGWGIMVPQPMSELVARVKDNQSAAFWVVLIEIIVLTVLSWFLSRQIAAPIQNVVAAAKKVSAGDLSVRVAKYRQPFVIEEVLKLGESFNQVIIDLQKDRLKLTEALRLAQEGVRTKSRFLAIASHEIRTPMHGVMGILNLLDEDCLKERQHQLVSTAQVAGNDLVKLLDDVLRFSKLEAKDEVVQEKPFNVMELVNGVSELFHPLAIEKGLTLKAVAPDRNLIGDSELLGHVLFNLVGNAIKFTDRGQIGISTEIDFTLPSSASLIISVKDSGIGICKGKFETIFEEFFQVETELNRRFEGTGLGLAISKRIVELMKGRITLESEIGKGSCFTVSVPILIK